MRVVSCVRFERVGPREATKRRRRCCADRKRETKEKYDATREGKKTKKEKKWCERRASKCSGEDPVLMRTLIALWSRRRPEGGPVLYNRAV